MYAQIDALTSTKPSKAIVPLLQVISEPDSRRIMAGFVMQLLHDLYGSAGVI